jgi:hypothetical protein
MNVKVGCADLKVKFPFLAGFEEVLRGEISPEWDLFSFKPGEFPSKLASKKALSLVFSIV